MAGTAVAKVDEMKGAIEREFSAIKNVLPGMVDPKRFANVALQAIVRQPDLLACSQASIVQSVVQAAQLGLEVGGPLRHASLVPFKGTATLIPEYRGLIYLAVRSGSARKVVAHVVMEGDEFSAELGTEDRIIHRPNFDSLDRHDDAKITHAYAVAWLPDGSTQFVVLTRSEIERVRRASRGGNKPDSPWVNWWGEMAKKTAVRRLLKMIPVSADVAQAIELDNRFETGEVGAPIPGDPEPAAEPAPKRRRSRTESVREHLEQRQGRDVTPASAPAPAEPEPTEEDEAKRLKAKRGMYFALLKERRPDLSESDFERHRWQEETTGKAKAEDWGVAEFDKAIDALKAERIPGEDDE